MRRCGGRLAAEGAAVAVNYVANAEAAESLVDELTGAGHQAAAFRADVGDVGQTKELVERVVDTCGGIDLLASNAGVEHFGGAGIHHLAPELAERDIAINAVAPGGTETDTAAENAEKYPHPALADVPVDAVLRSTNALGRLAQPDEIASVVAYLLSQDASYITGATLDAAGGWF